MPNIQQAKCRPIHVASMYIFDNDSGQKLRRFGVWRAIFEDLIEGLFGKVAGAISLEVTKHNRHDLVLEELDVVLVAQRPAFSAQDQGLSLLVVIALHLDGDLASHNPVHEHLPCLVIIG